MAFIVLRDLIPTRAVIFLLMFSCTFVLYMIRINLSILLLAMVEPIKRSNISVTECSRIQKNVIVGHANESDNMANEIPDYGVRYDWDPKLQGLILGAYFWGFTLTGMPAGALAERFGAAKCIYISFLGSGLLTLLGPWMAALSPVALMISRFLVGALAGVVYPSLHYLVARWAPPDEKGKFMFSLMGGSLGTVATWPTLGSIIETLGWKWAYVMCGVIVLIWTLLWHLLVFDCPEDHSRISEKEKNYIKEKLGANVVKNIKTLPPYKDIATSMPFWALTILHFGNLWGLFFLMTAGPNFMSTVLDFNLGHTGILAALPYLARLVFGYLFGELGDLIIRRQWMKKMTIRKSFVLFSHILPGVLLFAQTLTGCDPTWAIVLITLSLGSNGASNLTNLQNAHDLSPNFAATLYGIINCIGSTSGFISPLIVGYMTASHNGLHEWHKIFYIGSSVYIGCGLIFWIFGSADIQPWNTVDVKKNVVGVENVAFDSMEIDSVKKDKVCLK